MQSIIETVVIITAMGSIEIISQQVTRLSPCNCSYVCMDALVILRAMPRIYNRLPVFWTFSTPQRTYLSPSHCMPVLTRWKKWTRSSQTRWVSCLEECNSTCTLIYVHIHYLIDLLATQWRRAKELGQELEQRVFYLPTGTSTFKQYYDETQQSLKTLSGMDPFVEG